VGDKPKAAIARPQALFVVYLAAGRAAPDGGVLAANCVRLPYA
jgi:hypothetical protein